VVVVEVQTFPVQVVLVAVARVRQVESVLPAG